MASQGLKKPNWIVKLAAGNLVSMVVVGALGGHKKEWAPLRQQRFTRAQMYHGTVSMGLLMAGTFAFPLQKAIVAALCTSQLTFVSPLYYLAFTDEHTFRKAMPLGGGAFLAGFALMLV